MLQPARTAAQTEAGWEPVFIERGEVLHRYFSADIIRKSGTYKILHFGDSHIQADMITGEIRKTLQAETTAGGSGLIFPMSLCGSFGPAGVKSRISGTFSWSTFLKNPEKRPIGICGYEITLQRGSVLNMDFNESFHGICAKNFSVWIYSEEDSNHLDSLPRTSFRREKLSPGLYRYHFQSDSVIRSLPLKMRRTCSFWGLEFHPEEGLVYQQSGLVGAQFLHLASSGSDFFTQLESLKPDLLIFSYGSNEAYETIDSSRYRKKISAFLETLSRQLPRTGFLLTNAPDTRSGGRTPVSQVAVNSAIAETARDLKLPFFDWNRAMGGWGSLYKWEKKQLFLSDLLHFSRKGAVLTGQLFSFALLECGRFNEENQKNLQNRLSVQMSEVLSSEIKSGAEEEESPAGKPAAKSDVSEARPEKHHAKAVQNAKQRLYEVKQGDNLTLIAQKTRTRLAVLIRLNQLDSPDKLRIGQKIRY